MDIIFRKPDEKEIFKIYQHYTRVIYAMQENGIYQWDDLYPNSAVIAADIAAEDLTVGETDGRIACVFSVNTECEDEYALCPWSKPDEPYAVVHRLAVNPELWHQGIAKMAMEYIEENAKEKGIKTIRLDTFTGNPFAVALCSKLGYSVVGYADWRMGKFQIMEKLI